MRNYKEFLPEFVWPALGLSPWRSWGGGSLFCGGFLSSLGNFLISKFKDEKKKKRKLCY
jgi:hypothetical protein